MIRKVETQEEAFRLADMCWQINQDPRFATRPLGDSVEEVREYFGINVHPDDELLVCEEDGELKGIFCLFVDEPHQYLQSQGGFYALVDEYEDVFDEFMDYLTEKFEGWQLNIGMPEENHRLGEYMMEIGASCIENTIIMVLEKQAYVRCDHPDVDMLKQEDWMEFIEMHHALNPDMFWQGDMIISRDDLFQVFVVKREGHLAGALVMMICEFSSEIFCCEVKDEYIMEGYQKQLMDAAAQCCFEDCHQEELASFVDVVAREELKACRECGFAQVGTHIGYRLVLHKHDFGA